jgi:hypothetical protein
MAVCRTPSLLVVQAFAVVRNEDLDWMGVAVSEDSGSLKMIVELPASGKRRYHHQRREDCDRDRKKAVRQDHLEGGGCPSGPRSLLHHNY